MTKLLDIEISSPETLIKSFTDSTATGGYSQEELLQHLDRLGVEWHITEEGDLWIRYWQIGAENFVPKEQVAQIRQQGNCPIGVNSMEWVSKNLSELRKQYGGKWVAVVNESVIAAAPDMSGLLEQLKEQKEDRPFITQIPAEPIVWNTAYAHQII